MTRYIQQNKTKARLIVYKPYAGKPTREFAFDESEGFGWEGEKVEMGEYDPAMGNASRENATLRKRYTDVSTEEEAWIDGARGTRVDVIRFYQGDDKLPAGQRTYPGLLSACTPPEGSVGANEFAMLTVGCILFLDAV